MKKISLCTLYILIFSGIALGFFYQNQVKDFFSTFFSQEKSSEHLPEADKIETLASHHHSEIESNEVVKLTEDQIKKSDILIQTAASGQLTLTLSTRGKIMLDPDRLAHIIPKVSGIAKEARKNIGNSTRQGEIIAILESQEIADTKAFYLAAISKEKLAAGQLKREESLHQRKISSEQDFLNAQNAYEEARINLQLARQKLKVFGLNDEDIFRLADEKDLDLRLYQIEAPMDGTVIMRHITKGEFIKNGTTIYEIADLSTLWVEIGIYPKDLHRIHEGQQVEILCGEDSSKALANLIYVSPIISHETISSKAIALLDNPQGKWRPGSYVNVNISTDLISTPLMITKQAVLKINGADYIFVQTEKGFEKKALKLGRYDQQNVEVLSGLIPGERYVAKNPFLLKAELNKNTASHED